MLFGNQPDEFTCAVACVHRPKRRNGVGTSVPRLFDGGSRGEQEEVHHNTKGASLVRPGLLPRRRVSHRVGRCQAPTGEASSVSGMHEEKVCQRYPPPDVCAALRLDLPLPVCPHAVVKSMHTRL